MQGRTHRIRGIAWSSIAGLALAGCQTLAPTPKTVEGTGDPAKDVPALQAAVDTGGPVVLRGTFDFGERGQVILRRDVDISGLEGATIRGGFLAFSSPVPDVLPPVNPGPRIAIRNLSFTGTLWAPINIGYASGLVVTGIRVSALRPSPAPIPGIAGGQMQAGVLFGMAWAQKDVRTRRYSPGVFTGAVRIERNEIDVQVARPATTLGYGIFGQWTDGVDAIIADNRIRGASRTAFEVIDHYRDKDGRGRIVVRRNRLATANAGIPFPGKQTPNGILVGYFSDRKAALDPKRAVKMDVVDNVVETSGANSMGIAVLANDVSVKGNTVTVRGKQSLAIMVAGSGGKVEGNELRGTGGVGLVVAPFDVLAGSHNRVNGNDFSRLEVGGPQILLGKGSSDNVCEQNKAVAKVADQGLNNHCR
ncbi:MAG: hypothetical protein H6934_01460 [Burkholderiaceae bacterium]|nr:hypothetical protein [Burkholderiaceae bacterium]